MHICVKIIFVADIITLKTIIILNYEKIEKVTLFHQWVRPKLKQQIPLKSSA